MKDLCCHSNNNIHWVKGWSGWSKQTLTFGGRNWTVIVIHPSQPDEARAADTGRSNCFLKWLLNFNNGCVYGTILNKTISLDFSCIKTVCLDFGLFLPLCLWICSCWGRNTKQLFSESVYMLMCIWSDCTRQDQDRIFLLIRCFSSERLLWEGYLGWGSGSCGFSSWGGLNAARSYLFCVVMWGQATAHTVHSHLWHEAGKVAIFSSTNGR